VITWVLLRGLTRETAHWGRFPALLTQASSGARIVCIDLPGAGQRRPWRCPWRVEAMLPFCRRQLAQAGVAPPYHLLGLSLGGMVAAAWAEAYPEEVAASVLVNTSMRPFSPPQQRLRPVHLPLLLRLLLPASPRLAEQTLLRLTSTAPQSHAALIADWIAIRLQRARRPGRAALLTGAGARPGPRARQPSRRRP
jgi:pimeloyl-ACP methyl ester carboxylesterase